MPYETIIVAFDSAARATAAIHAVRKLGVPASDIKRHPADENSVADAAAAVVSAPTEPGFWSWLFGRDAEERQVKLYQQALQRGGTVVSVRVLEDEAERVRELIEAFAPLDLKETLARL
jgi:hypothetical protein